MAILKCKMCGGNLEIQNGMNVYECEYCGSVQTVPTLDDEKKISLFARANRLRSACEFDKASGIYESIVAEFPEEAEAYWGLILCKYGIEYIDDPRTGKKIPTCHRTSFHNLMDDENFDLVMEYSEPTSRAVYREEAKKIEQIRVGIVEISSNEDPYDIFICYKETAEDGQRTIDSVIAQDVYDALSEQGYKVFFSRITLEDKLGQEYEPYIFAALNSAKVMLVFGSDYQYFNAVWVKNEWKRYLSLIEKGEKKTLIPCYKGVDAYDMPKEFMRFQAQDMGKVGAMQDLLRGINKIISPKNMDIKDSSAEMKVTEQSGVSKTALLKRGNMALEDAEWENAKKYFDQVLNIDAENGQAYLGLAMSEWKINTIEMLEKEIAFLEVKNNKNFSKAMLYLEDGLKSKYRKFLEQKNKKDFQITNILNKKRNVNKKTEDMIINPWLYLKPDGKILAKEDYYNDWKKIKQICFHNYDTIGITVDGDVRAVYTDDDNETEKCYMVENIHDAEEVVYLDKDVLVIRTKSGSIRVINKNPRTRLSGFGEFISEILDVTPNIKKIGKITDLSSDARCVILTLDNRLQIFFSHSYSIKKEIIDVKDFSLTDNDEIFCLKNDGTVSRVVPRNIEKEEKNYKKWAGIIKIETNYDWRSEGSCIFGLKNNGKVMFSGSVKRNIVPVGYSKYVEVKFEVDKWEDITDISYNGCDCIMGLKADGTVVVAGNVNDSITKSVSKWKDVVAVKSGKTIRDDRYLIALNKDGEILHTVAEPELAFLNNQKLFENFETIEEKRANILLETEYEDGIENMKNKSYAEAILNFKKIEFYKDSASLIEECEEQKRKDILDKIKSIEEAIYTIICDMEEKDKLKKEKELKLNSLGIFAGKEKRILRQEIEQLEQTCVDLMSKKTSNEMSLEDYRKKLNN